MLSHLLHGNLCEVLLVQFVHGILQVIPQSLQNIHVAHTTIASSTEPLKKGVELSHTCACRGNTCACIQYVSKQLEHMYCMMAGT